MEVRERETINQNNPPPPPSNQDSSSIFTNYAPLNSSNTTTTETPDRLLGLHLQHTTTNHYHGLQQDIEAQRESNPDPDSAEPLSQTPPPPLQPPESALTAVVVRYKECLKNHAATMGSHVVDGCGEFMANGEEGTPESLLCAACECHRSFHRREVEGESQPTTTRIPAAIHNPQLLPPRAATMQPPHQQHHHHHHRYNYNHQTPPFMVGFGGNSTVAPTESSSEDLDMFRTHMMDQQPLKKRFRTKFTEEQKEKMHDFAERIGWKFQKQNEQEILHFCNEVGLKRQVFKVWMHNSKQAMKKKQM